MVERRTVTLRNCPLWQLVFIALLGTAALLTRHVHGYAWCQEYWNWDGKRHCKADGRRWPANDGVVITYINGIFHSVPEWESITHQLQSLFGHEVRPFYNPSSGWWITDASKAGYHMLRRPGNDTIAKALGDHLAQAVEDVGRGRVLHIAHSGGALITYLAAAHHLTRRQRDKIDVLTFGGARSITRKYFSGRVVNYYARNDPLVKLDRRAAELMKLTNNTKFQVINEKHNTTFVFLEGRAKQFVLDHSLEGPTYQHALRREAKAFRRAHFGPLSPLSWDYEQSIFRLVRKKVAQLSGLHGFLSTERLGLRSLRKSVARLTGLHGFFSGKKGSGANGVSISIVGNRKRDAAEVAAAAAAAAAAREAEDAAAESSGARRRRWWLPWGEGRDSTGSGSGNDNGGGKVPQVSPGPAGGDVGRGALGGGDRFWIGFRWPQRRGDEEQRQGGKGEIAGRASDRGAPPPLDADESTARAGSEEGQGVARRSRWAQVRGVWGFGRREEPAAEVSELPPSHGDENGEKEAEATASGDRPDSSLPSPETSSRPWMSVGWTPWGGRAKAGRDSSALPAEGEGGGDGGDGAEIPPATQHDPAAAIAAGATSIAEGGGEGAGADADVSPAAAGSFLWRWWPAGTGGTDAAQETGADDVAAGGKTAGDNEADNFTGKDGGIGAGDIDAAAAAGVEEGEDGAAGESWSSSEEPEHPEEPEHAEAPEHWKEPGGSAEREQAQSTSSPLWRWWPGPKQEGSAAAAASEDCDLPNANGMNTAQFGVGTVDVSGGGVVVSVDDGQAEGVENRGDSEGPNRPGEAQLTELSSVAPGEESQREKEAGEEEEGEGTEEEEEEEEEGDWRLERTTSSGVGGTMSAGQQAASFARRFWEVFTNKAADPHPDEVAPAGAADRPARVKDAGTGSSDDASESLPGEVVVAEGTLLPEISAGDLPPSPVAADTVVPAPAAGKAGASDARQEGEVLGDKDGAEGGAQEEAGDDNTSGARLEGGGRGGEDSASQGVQHRGPCFRDTPDARHEDDEREADDGIRRDSHEEAGFEGTWGGQQEKGGSRGDEDGAREGVREGRSEEDIPEKALPKGQAAGRVAGHGLDGNGSAGGGGGGLDRSQVKVDEADPAPAEAEGGRVSGVQEAA